MFDYFIAVGVTLIALAVVYFMFQSIKKSEVVAVVAPRERRSRRRRAPAASAASVSPKKNALDKEMEALIAREIARPPASSMRSDARVLQPTIIQDTRVASTAPAKGKARQGLQQVIPEKQILIDKELGFQRVTNPSKERRNGSPSAPPATTQDDELDRKLSNFFKSSGRKNKNSFKTSLKDDHQASGSGAYVLVRKDISNARTW